MITAGPAPVTGKAGGGSTGGPRWTWDGWPPIVFPDHERACSNYKTRSFFAVDGQAVVARERRLILVTGIPRSGTTPCGSNLELARGARHLYEPFNPGYGMHGISRHFEVPGANEFTMERFDRCIESIRRLRLRLKRYYNPREVGGVRRVVKWLAGDRARVAYWRCRLDPAVDTVIWKDPNACFATQAAVDRHRIPVVVTVRPAAAVAASYKRMGWEPGLPQVLNSLSQIGITFPRLLSDNERFIGDRAVAAGMLWYVIYSTLMNWAETRPLIRLVNLQDTIDHPVEYYQDLYQWLDLPWSQQVAEGLRRRYPVEPPPPAAASDILPQRAHVRKRTLSRVNTYGADLLTAEEKEIIEHITGGLWARLQEACLAAPVPSPGARGDQPHDLATSG